MMSERENIRRIILKLQELELCYMETYSDTRKRIDQLKILIQQYIYGRAQNSTVAETGSENEE